MEKSEVIGWLAIVWFVYLLTTIQANENIECTEDGEEVIVNTSNSKMETKEPNALHLELMDPYWIEDKNWHEGRVFKFYRQTINVELIKDIALKCDQSRKKFTLQGMTFVKCKFEINLYYFLKSFGSKIMFSFLVFDGYMDIPEEDSPAFPFDEFMELFQWFSNKQLRRIMLDRTKLSKDQMFDLLYKIEMNTDTRRRMNDRDDDQVITLAMCYDGGGLLPFNDEFIRRRLYDMSQDQKWDDHAHSQRNDVVWFAQFKSDSDYIHQSWFVSQYQADQFFRYPAYKLIGELVAIRKPLFHFQIYKSYFHGFGFLDSSMNFKPNCTLDEFNTRLDNYFNVECGPDADPFIHTSREDGEGDEVQFSYRRMNSRLDDGNYTK